MRKVYTSIDIGSDTIKFVVGENLNNQVKVLSSYEIKSKGIRKGLVIDSNLASNAIKDGIKEINKDFGFDIKKVIVNVSEEDARFKLVSASMKVEGAITSDIISKLIKTSVYNKLDNDYELVTAIPIDFVIDGTSSGIHVINKKATEVELKAIMISVPKKNIYSVIEVIEKSNLEVVDIILPSLGDYYEIRSKFTDNKVGAIINLGHETTNVSVFNHGKLMNVGVINLGGLNVDKDLAYVFGINIFDGRMLKERFASSHKRFNVLNDTFEIKNTIGETIKLNQLEVTEVVMSRLVEILNFAKKQILLLTKQEIDYIIITGGLTEIKSFKNLITEVFGKGALVYKVDTIGVRDNKYTTALGMIKYFIDKMNVRGKEYSMISETDEELLVKPDSKLKKENIDVIGKMFKNFIKNKEEE